MLATITIGTRSTVEHPADPRKRRLVFLVPGPFQSQQTQSRRGLQQNRSMRFCLTLPSTPDSALFVIL